MNATAAMLYVVGGKVGLVSWLVSLTAVGAGWLLWGTKGAAIGAVVSKLSYIPWLYGIYSGARR